MTKNDMVVCIARATNCRQADIKRVVQMTLDGIIDVLSTEGRIELRNFGVFTVKKRKARKARNPQTGEAVMVPEKNVVKFKPSHLMHERTQGLAPYARRSPETGSAVEMIAQDEPATEAAVEIMAQDERATEAARPDQPPMSPPAAPPPAPPAPPASPSLQR